jgi:NADH dehydrogenase FAD-containing subunit
MTGNTDVVVIGGGYAGVMAANRLTQRDDVTVTLINPRTSFVERLGLHQLVGGPHEAVVDALGPDSVADVVARPSRTRLRTPRMGWPRCATWRTG